MTVKKTTQLKKLIQSSELSFLMEAHNGLSAKIVEEAGFEGIWASGLSISASLGVRDNNEASWTQVLEVAEYMSDATTIPILLDGDTGYGNFNSMRRLVRKLESRGVAGVCIEDKLFPKTNSFIRGSAQPLAEIEEFAGKLKAGKDAQTDDDFIIVARVEAFIAGWGLDEAMKRAEAYRLAGADAILIHSALRSPSEILEFKKAWGDRLPVVIVPTKYYTTPTDVFRDQKFSVCIWANHLMRAAITTMRKTAKQIHDDQNLLKVEDEVVSVAEVFKIQGEDELAQAEKRYLPQTAQNARAIVLAASRGKELGSLTEDRPKTMVHVGGKPILAHITASLRDVGVKDISVVRGYKKDAVNLASLRYFDNPQFESTQEVGSLLCAKSVIEEKGVDSLLLMYGDVMLRKHVIQDLVETEGDMIIAVDSNLKDGKNKGRFADYVVCSEPVSKRSFYSKVLLKSVSHDSDAPGLHGEWMGVVCLRQKAREALIAELNETEKSPDQLKTLKLPDLFSRLQARGVEIRVVYTTGAWMDVDSAEDLVGTGDFT
jgi:phosphoenolpyruvate phosphomutase